MKGLAKARDRVLAKKNCQSEHQHGAALMQWVQWNLKKYPDLERLYHIPNGGLRSKVASAKLKAEGVKPGIPDYHLPVARGGFIGLYCELKIKGNYPSDAQWKQIYALRKEGHFVCVAVGWEEARNFLMQYLARPPTMWSKAA